MRAATYLLQWNPLSTSPAGTKKLTKTSTVLFSDGGRTKRIPLYLRTMVGAMYAKLISILKKICWRIGFESSLIIRTNGSDYRFHPLSHPLEKSAVLYFSLLWVRPISFKKIQLIKPRSIQRRSSSTQWQFLLSSYTYIRQLYILSSYRYIMLIDFGGVRKQFFEMPGNLY